MLVKDRNAGRWGGGRVPVRELTLDVSGPSSGTGSPTSPSAIAFRVVLSIVPFPLVLPALIGFLDLEEIWRQDVAPELKKSASEAAFRLSSGSGS
jgi:uncharacterized BrkB/YihY/UPF0761 family membrane protein